MNARARRTTIFAVGFLLCVILFLVGLSLFLDSARFRNWLQSELSIRSGSAVKLGRVHFHFPLGIGAEQVQIEKPGIYTLESGLLVVQLSPMDLGSNTIGNIELTKPVLRLDLQAWMESSREGSINTAVRRLNVRDGSLVLKLTEGNTIELRDVDLTAENLNVGRGAGIELSTDVPALESTAEIRIDGALPDLQLSVNLRRKIARSLFTGGVEPKETLRVNGLLHAPDNQPPWMNVEAQAQQFDFAGRSITAILNSRIDFDLNNRSVAFSAQGQLDGFPAVAIPTLKAIQSGPAELAASGQYAAAANVLTVDTFNVKSHLGSASAQGQFTFANRVITADLQAVLREVPCEALKSVFPAPSNQWTYDGVGEAELNLRGPLDRLELSGVARSSALTLRAAEFTLGPVNLYAPLQVSNSSLQVKDFRVQGKNFSWKDNKREGGAEAVALEGMVSYGPARPITFSGRLNLGSGRLRSSSGAQTAVGEIALDASLTYQQGPGLTAQGQMQIRGAKFSSADSSRVGENLAIANNFKLAIPEKGTLALDTAMSMDSGEILWGKFFTDLKKQKPLLDFSGEYSNAQDRLICRRCDLTVAGVGQVKTEGEIAAVTQSPSVRLQARSENFMPGEFFDSFLREPFKREYPLLEKIAVGGQLAFKMQAQGPLDGLTLAGELALKNGDVRATSNEWQIGPMALNLPFQLRLTGSDAKGVTAGPSGLLAIQSARLGSQNITPVKTAISLQNNQLRFSQPIQIGIFGGTVEISNLFWADVIRAPKQFSFSAKGDRIQLLDLTRAIGWHPFNGALTASIPQVQSSPEILRTLGEIHADVFGGRIEMAKLEIENPFSSLASIRTDLTLRNISLEQASKTFEFGRISGVLEGTISDLVITNGQPSQFRADLYSVDRGTEQRISVEALNKITVLSSGQSGGAVYGGLAGLFDTFRYSRLGFKATLKNDRLSLRGIESRDGKEFLVVGTILPPTVNIISHTQEIGFGELMRRLEQIKNSDKAQVK